MAEFNYDKKREHERLAVAAIDSGELDLAYFHIKEAITYTMVLAARCGGVLGQAYVANANGLLDVAEKLKSRISNQATAPSAKTKVADIATETRGGESGDTTDKKRWAIEKNTGIRLDDVKGLAEAKAVVIDALINPVRHPDVYKTLKVKPSTGLLLYGPPGTGKTMFAKAIANEMDTAFMHVKMSELKSKYVGETEQNIASMFKEARSYKRCVLFLDECESLLRKRGNQKVNAVEAFLVELDGFKPEGENHLFVLLATNRPWLLDSALTRSGRISTHVYVDLPDRETRELIIRSALADVPLADDVNIGELADKTEGFSGAELHHEEHGGGLCDLACLYAARRWIARREATGPSYGAEAGDAVEPVAKADFEAALEYVVPTSKRDADIIKRNLAYKQSGGVVGDDTAEGED